MSERVTIQGYSVAAVKAEEFKLAIDALEPGVAAFVKRYKRGENIAESYSREVLGKFMRPVKMGRKSKDNPKNEWEQRKRAKAKKAGDNCLKHSDTRALIVLLDADPLWLLFDALPDSGRRLVHLARTAGAATSLSAIKLIYEMTGSVPPKRRLLSGEVVHRPDRALVSEMQRTLKGSKGAALPPSYRVEEGEEVKK